jgi:hypothetical protein
MWVFGVFGPFDHNYVQGSGDTSVFGGADVMLTIAVIYLIVAALAAVVMTAMNMGKGRGNSKIGLYVYGGLVVLAFVFYFTIAKSITVFGADGTPFSDVFTLKATDTMLYLAYFALAAVVVFLLIGEVRKALK